MTPERALTIIANAAKDAPRTLGEHQQIQACVQILIEYFNHVEQKAQEKKPAKPPKAKK